MAALARQNGNRQVIRVAPVPEPSEFNERARQRGKAWLEENAGASRPRDYWLPFREILADGCQHRCSYTAMYTTDGTIDHFRSWKYHPELAYEWKNYRYAGEWLNKVKRDREVLDPHEVGDGWFEILLPSLQLVATDTVPDEFRSIVLQTMKHLRLVDDERVLKQRRQWYNMYEQGALTLDGLSRVAPLIAIAVEKQLAMK